jgi:hypothetical protein
VGLAEITASGIDFQCCEQGCLHSPELGAETMNLWVGKYAQAKGAVQSLGCLRDLLVARPNLCDAAIFEWLGINRKTTSMVVRPLRSTLPCRDVAL